MITLIASCSKNGVIGRNGALPWHNSEDLRYFRQQTVGKTVLMGRKTWESLGCRPLQGRHNLVVSRSFHLPGASGKWKLLAFADLQEALKHSRDVMVIGGAEIYRQCLPFV